MRVSGAAPEPSRWRSHDAELGAARGVNLIRGEAQGHHKDVHVDAGPLSGGELRRHGRAGSLSPFSEVT